VRCQDCIPRIEREKSCRQEGILGDLLMWKLDLN
jgi:hypothetical protein